MPSDSVRFVLRSSLTLGSLFTGAGIAHAFLKPDLVCELHATLRVRQRHFALLHSCASSVHVCAQSLPDLNKPAAAAPTPDPKDVEGFVPSAAFAGPKPGMVFKAGAGGVGYYPDRGN